MELKLTQGELNQRAGEIRSIAEQIHEQLTQAESRVDQLLSGWVGAASTSFSGVWQDWHTSAQRCHDDLMKIADAMDHSGTSFQEHEDYIRQSLDRMRT